MSRLCFFLVCLACVYCTEHIEYKYDIKFANIAACGGDDCPPRPGNGLPSGGGTGGGGAPDTDHSIIDRVWATGRLNCGAADGSNRARGVHQFSADLCRAVAAAFWDDTRTQGETRVNFVPTNEENRYDLLRNGDVDIVSHNVVRTALRAATQKISFGPVMLYDRVGVLADTTIRSWTRLLNTKLELARVCVVKGEPTVPIAARLMGIDMEESDQMDRLVMADTLLEAFNAWQNDQCAFVVNNALSLQMFQPLFGRDRSEGKRGTLLFPTDPEEFKESPSNSRMLPIAPMVPRHDQMFALLVDTVLNGLIIAAERDYTRKQAVDDNQGESKLYDNIAEVAEALNLGRGFMRNVIRAVGNFDEMWDRAFPRSNAAPLRRVNSVFSADGSVVSHL